MIFEYIPRQYLEKGAERDAEKSSYIKDRKTRQAVAATGAAIGATVSLVLVLTSTTGYFIPPASAVPNSSLGLTKGVPSNLRSSFEEVLDKFYALNSKVESGINYRGYSEEVGNLKVAFDRLGRKPGAKNYDSYKHLGAAILNYQDAKKLWQLCVEGRNCEHNLIDTAASPVANVIVKKYGIATLDKMPGVTADDFPNHIFLDEGLSRIWSVASGHITKAGEKL
ncbi:MAG: hypothetical protein KME26_14200 [Oscillatoria princeps RMCB-10]|jgi:hypothetical protein|nr:hypothetical protein [Oscillatoria princeps RMCB-10]